MAEFVMQLTFCPKKSQRGGFTLLEIMIALAIVSIAMVSLLSLANRSIGVHDRLQRITARHGALEGAEVQGEFSEPYAAYRWQITYAETPLPSVQMVTVKVLWGDEERNELVDLTSFIF